MKKFNLHGCSWVRPPRIMPRVPCSEERAIHVNYVQRRAVKATPICRLRMGSRFAMDARTRTPSSVLLLLLLFSLSILPLATQGSGHGGGGEKEDEAKRTESEEQARQGPLPVERAIGLTFDGFASRWDAVKTWAKMAWMNLKTPDSMKGNGKDDSSAGSVAKESASKSVDESKVAVERAQETAAKVAEKAVHKTKEKAEGTASTPSGIPDAEL